MTDCSTLVLASQSPRRRELLMRFGVPFEVVAPKVDEVPLGAEAPADYALRTAGEKGREVAERVEQSVGSVLSADTVVSIDDRILGKPADLAEARDMLRCLSGRVHTVYTGVVLIDAVRRRTFIELDETRVWFRELESREIEAYVGREVVMDKAGAYAIQGSAGSAGSAGPASHFIPRICGNYSNVVGLPLPIVFDLFRRAGVIPG